MSLRIYRVLRCALCSQHGVMDIDKHGRLHVNIYVILFTFVTEQETNTVSYPYI